MVPYDRTLLSKALPAGDASKFALRPPEFLTEADIDYKLKKSVFKINTEVKKVILTNGEHIFYDKLCVAPGSYAWAPPVPGFNLPGVYQLRTNQDQEKIKEACKGAKNIVIAGASFIGSECAASLKMHYKENVNITVINGDPTPFYLPFGPEIGAYFQK